YKIEKEITRKYYEKDKPQDVGKSYSTVDSKAYIIFPYANGHSIDPNKLQKDYPLAWRYLNNFKNDLLKRDIRGGDNDHWYRYGRQQYLKEAYRDKIIAGVM
ncbi:restriction endonuclease, partial [Salmonella enterica subsp. enterica serovar Enteritidis]